MSDKDLVADILPPPAYIIEAFLVTQLMNDAGPDALPGLVAKADALEREFHVRHDHWRVTLKDAALRREMLEEAYEPAVRFFGIVREAFVPALKANDRKAASVALAKLTSHYEAHRRAVDRVVELANTQLSSIEAETATLIDTGKRVW